jgi:hypothetical protein
VAESRVKYYERRLKEMKEEKRPWLPHYQALAEVFHSRKADFTKTRYLGDFLQDEIFDNTPQFAADMHASVCMSILWPDAARTFNIVPAKAIKEFPGVEAYFKAVSALLHANMDRPEAGLVLAFEEHFRDQAVFGTSGVATLDGPDDDLSLPAVYEMWDVKTMYIAENFRGYVDTVYVEVEKTVRQVMGEYGAGKNGDKVASKLKELAAAGKWDDKVTVLKVLEPKTPLKDKRGYHAMPWRSCHVDLTHSTIMREGGFEELPVAVARALKRAGETQGRSFGMVALPAAINLNQISEGVIAAAEKNLEPPLGVLDDGRLGGTVIDKSAGGITVINTAGRPMGEKPIFPLYTVGEMQSTKELKEQLIEEVLREFLLDKLLELGGDRPMMTAYETSVRNRLRGESAGSVFMRQIVEVIVPTIKRTFNIHYRKGYLGDFPGIPENAPGVVQRRLWAKIGGKDELAVPEIVVKAMQAGLDVYDIEFISPAQRFMHAEKLTGLMSSMDAKLAVAAMRPEILDGTDVDTWSRLVDKLSGSPLDAQRTKDDIKKLRAEVAERQNMAAAMEAGQVMSDIQLKSAQARSKMGTAPKG